MCPGKGSESVGERSSLSDAGEDQVAKELGWFAIRRTKNSRYVYVNASKYGIVWINCVFFVSLHFYYVYAIYTLFAQKLWLSWIWIYWYGFVSGLGVTCGAHRTYQATLPLRIFYIILHTMAGQNDMITWVRDHRLHHKYTETSADPHNSRRGAFFSHVGWLLTRKHPDVLVKGKTISNEDILADPVCAFQKRHYIWLYIFFRLVFPMWVPMHFWGVQFGWALIGVFAQYITSLHITWFVNSAAHIFGERPYNGKIQPRENPWISWIAMGEGYHNYHHTFPWDYAIAEFGLTWYDPAKTFIDAMAYLGLATNLKKASPELVAKTVLRVGHGHQPNNNEKSSRDGSNPASSSKWDHEFYLDDHPYEQPHPYLDDTNQREACAVDGEEGKLGN